MRPQASFFASLATSPWRMALLTVLIAIPIAVSATGAGWLIAKSNESEAMSRQLELLKHQVDSATLNGNVMGAVTMLGTYNMAIKQQASGTLPPDSPQTMEILKSVVDRFNASNAFIMNKAGTIVAYVTQKGKSGTGKKLDFRPYFTQAINGTPNVYAGVGFNSGKRGLYFAAPIYSIDRDMVWTEIIGIVAIKLDLLFVDSLLSQIDSPVMLVSPQGVVFSSNRPDWLFSVVGIMTLNRLKSIRNFKQFGKIFDSLTPTSLPVDIHTGTASMWGAQQAMAEVRINWNDPLGDWHLVMLSDRMHWFTVTSAAPYGVGALLICALFGIAAYYRMKELHNRRLATKKLAEANWRMAERGRRYRTIFRKSPLGLVHFDADGMIVNCNDRFVEILDLPDSELIGSNFVEEAESLEVQTALTDACGGRASTFEGQYISTYSDRSLPLRMIFTPISPGSPPSEVIASVEDITGRRKMEAAMFEAMEAAEENAKAKSDFLANMSHEIRTPMNAIIGLADLALQRKADAVLRDYVKKIQGSANTLLGIINDILDFSKIEAGKLRVETIDFSLDTVLENVADVSCMKAEEKGLEVLFCISPDIPSRLVGDPIRLGQILTNYLNNAVKFTQEGQIELCVDVESREQDKIVLNFSVTDTGVGLSEKEMSKLFQSFSQADGSTTRQFGGTGLGLAISKQLAELMGGSVGVESASGQGSTFWFKVVLGIGREAGESISSDSLRDMRCLVVDDNETSLEILEAALSSLSLKVRTATCAHEAIDELKRSARVNVPYELVLLDWKMPEIDGIEAAGIIASDKDIPYTPQILMVTAFGREEALKQAKEIGVNGVLSKPVNNSTLLSAILEIFNSEKAGVSKQPASPIKPNAAVPIWGAKVLLVEDNSINQLIATELLRKHLIEVEIAENGLEALEMVVRTDYDLVFMDVQMPVMDGLDATRAIRASGRKEDQLPIVAMTANAMRGDGEKCLAAGMNDYISKPIDKNEFSALLVKWIHPGVREIPPGIIAELNAKGANVEEQSLSLGEIDVEKGVSRVDGDRKFYAQIMQSFMDSNRNTVSDIKVFLDKGDRAAASRLVHTVKGVSTNIGAASLSLCAAELEEAVKDNDREQCAFQLKRFDRQLETVFSSISEYLGNMTIIPSEQGKRSALKAESAILLLEQALDLLDSDLGRSMELFEQLGTGLRASDFSPYFESLANHLSLFEMDEVRKQALGMIAMLKDRSTISTNDFCDQGRP